MLQGAARKGFLVNRKKVQRLLGEWGFTRCRPRPHPKQQSRPFDVVAPNVLWHTDLTAVWCGEDGWAYYCGVRLLRSVAPVVDVHATMQSSRCESGHGASVLSSFPVRLRRRRAVGGLRHDNGTQFTSIHYRDVASTLKIKLSRTAYRHPDGNAFIERLYRTLKEECVWPNDFPSFNEALAAITAWVVDYNTERPTTRSVSEHRRRRERRHLIHSIRQPECQPAWGSLRESARAVPENAPAQVSKSAELKREAIWQDPGGRRGQATGKHGADGPVVYVDFRDQSMDIASGSETPLGELGNVGLGFCHKREEGDRLGPLLDEGSQRLCAKAPCHFDPTVRR